MLNFLYHLFIPHHRNNHRSKILHNSSLLLIITLFFFLYSLLSFIQVSHPNILGTSYSVSEQELLDLTNKVRQDRGLPPLVLNSELSHAAELKAGYMFAKNYWAHFAPDGTTPWSFIKTSGYNYLYAGENLAKGFDNSNDIVNAWLQSPSHRENVLSDKYKDIGFAVMKGKLLGEDTILVVELFGSTEIPTYAKSQIKKPENVIEAPSVNSSAKNSYNTNPSKLLIKQSPILGQYSKTAFSNPIFDINLISKNIILVIFSILILAFIIDLIIVERKKIPRLVGHNIDHIFVIGLFIIFIIFRSTGNIF